MSPRSLILFASVLVVATIFNWRIPSGYRPRTPQTSTNSEATHTPATFGHEVAPPEISIGPPTGRIAFTSYRVGNASGLYTMTVTGSQVTSLTLGGGAAFAPNGQQLACVHFYLDTNRFEIALIDADGTLLQRLTESPDADSTNPAWSFDGRRIAFQSGDFNQPSIYVMNADGTERKALTAHKSHDQNPCWSPDGAHIAFSSYRDGEQGVFVMSSLGTDVRRLTDPEESCGDPEWSPTGDHIAFVAYDSRARQYSLRIMHFTTGEWWTVLDERERIESPTWSPNGDWIGFCMTADGNTDIYRVDALGKELVNLTNDTANDRAPSWSHVD